MQVTGFFWTGWSVSMSDWVEVARLSLGFGLFHSLRTSPETHTHHPHTRHAPRHSLSLSSWEHSLVSRFLSVASLISCLSCVSCLLSVLFCFCLTSVLCPVCFFFYWRLSVSVCPVCDCSDVCLKQANQ